MSPSLDCLDYFLELVVNRQKPKQQEIIKRKLDTYEYIFSRENIAEKEPFIVKQEHTNIPNSSAKKLENDVNDLEKENRVVVKRRYYVDYVTKQVIPRAKFLIPIQPLEENQIFEKIKNNYLRMFIQEEE